MSVRWAEMNCPAELLEAGDQVRRLQGGPWGKVTAMAVNGARVFVDLEINHGDGVELETWRPRIGVDVRLRYQLPESTVHGVAGRPHVPTLLRQLAELGDLGLVQR